MKWRGERERAREVIGQERDAKLLRASVVENEDWRCFDEVQKP